MLFFPNHPVVLGLRFEETAPRVHLLLPLPLPLLPPPRPCFCSPHVSVSAHPSHVSRELHWPKWLRSHAPTAPISSHPHTVRGPIGSSTEGANGKVRMRPARPFRHTPHCTHAHYAKPMITSSSSSGTAYFTMTSHMHRSIRAISLQRGCATAREGGLHGG